MSTTSGSRTIVLATCSVLWIFQSAIYNLQSAIAEEVQWRTEYNTARREAIEKSRPLLLDFTADNCFWCRKLDGTTFRDPTVVAVLNERFIPLKVDGQRDLLLVEALQVQSFPTLVLAAPDGKLLATYVGYLEVPRFQEILLHVLASQSSPEWMVRDYRAAVHAVGDREYARAIALLRGILEDGQQRPAQVQARQLLEQVEQEAAGRLSSAKQLEARGQTSEAVAKLFELLRSFTRTRAASEGSQLLTTLSGKPGVKVEVRARRAQDLLTYAREAYQARNYMNCLEHCEALTAGYSDLPESLEARRLAVEIKSNPDWLRQACDGLGERLGTFYLDLAETWVKKGQPHQAASCLERVVLLFPGSRQAELARTRLIQIKAGPDVPVEISLKVMQ